MSNKWLSCWGQWRFSTNLPSSWGKRTLSHALNIFMQAQRFGEFSLHCNRWHSRWRECDIFIGRNFSQNSWSVVFKEAFKIKKKYKTAHGLELMGRLSVIGQVRHLRIRRCVKIGKTIVRLVLSLSIWCPHLTNYRACLLNWKICTSMHILWAAFLSLVV